MSCWRDIWGSFSTCWVTACWSATVVSAFSSFWHWRIWAGLGKIHFFHLSLSFFFSQSQKKSFFFFLFLSAFRKTKIFLSFSFRKILIRNSNISFFCRNKKKFQNLSFYFWKKKKWETCEKKLSFLESFGLVFEDVSLFLHLWLIAVL